MNKFIWCLFLVVSSRYLFAQDIQKLNWLSEQAQKSNINLSYKFDTVKNLRQAAFEFALKYQYGRIPAQMNNIQLKEQIDSTKSAKWADDFVSFNIGVVPSLEILKPNIALLSDKLRPYSLKDSLPDYVNFFHWIQRFNANKFVIVNIPSADLMYFENGQLVLDMKVIVGTTKNQTPTLATFADFTTVYPYWVPTRNITIKEILPKVKKNISYLSNNNFEVIDKKGKIVDPSEIDWLSFSAKHFPYTLRQGTGCDNALGLLKINIKNSYSVYMHDTPHNDFNKNLFNAENRFFSHGCIRLEKPLDLVLALKPLKTIDDQLMNLCLKAKKPSIIHFEEEIPVFVTYFTKSLSPNGLIIHSQDIYKLNK